MRGIQSDKAGKYRKVQVIIKWSKHIPPSSFLVKEEMDAFFEWFIGNQQLYPAVLAADLHERLVTVHPFIDGNGRISRLVMNLFLLKHSYVMANIKGVFKTQSVLESIKRYVSILS